LGEPEGFLDVCEEMVWIFSPNSAKFVHRPMLNNVQTLIQNIQNAVDLAIWNVNGGPGSITFIETPSPSLIIRAPAELHYMMGGGGFSN
jgi:hypothetical protein